MAKGSKVEMQTLVVRLWREVRLHGTAQWQGTLIHPDTNRRVHFVTLAALLTEMTELLEDLNSFGGETDKM